MKFVFGLLAGSLSVLVLSSVVDFDWQPPTRLQPSVSVAASEATEPLAESLTESRGQSLTQSLPQSLSEPFAESVTEPAVEEPFSETIRSVTVAPLPAEPAPKPTPLPSLVQTSSPHSAASTADADEALEPSEPLVVANETAVIWKPFHSQVSAEGFARRLSTQLGYPFRALREGPAKYHVVFDYGNDQQRELLRDQVRALTGFSVL